MKLKKLVLIAIFIASVSFVFADTKVAVNEPGMIDVRSLGMGGTHVVDTTDFYTLLKNPAGIALSGKKNMISVVAVNAGLPSNLVSEDKVNSVIDDYYAGKGIDEILPTLLKDGMNVNLNVGVDGPLCFGKISENGFGWGFFETVNADANIPSLTLANVTAKVEAALILGYGLKFELTPGTALSVGVTGEAFAQVPRFAMQGSVASILSTFTGEGGFEDIPITAVVGVSCDAGVQLRLLNFIDAAIVWEDFYSPYMTRETTVGEAMNDPMILTSGFSAPELQTSNFRVGAGVNLLPNGGGLISALKVQVDIKDFMLFMRNFIDRELSALERSPWLNFNAGVEVGLMRFLYARAGYSDGYATIGASIKIGALNIDAAVYTKELGRTAGSNSQINGAVSVGLFY